MSRLLLIILFLLSPALQETYFMRLSDVLRNVKKFLSTFYHLQQNNYAFTLFMLVQW